MGSTPSMSQPGEEVKLVTEIHPGNYVFYGNYDIWEMKLDLAFGFKFASPMAQPCVLAFAPLSLLFQDPACSPSPHIH